MRTLLCVLLCVTPLSAQPVISAPAKILWDQDAATLTEANSYVVNLYLDSATVKTTLSGKACTGSAKPFTCSANLPAMTIGRHLLMISVSAPASATTPEVEGKPSDPFDIVLVVLPAKPVNVRVATP